MTHDKITTVSGHYLGAALVVWLLMMAFAAYLGSAQ